MIPIIAKREFKNVWGSKSMIISTIVMVVGIIALGFVGKYFVDKNSDAAPPVVSIGYEPQMADYADYLEEIGPQIETHEVQPDDVNTWLTAENEKESTSAIVLTGEPGRPTTVQEGGDMSNMAAREFVSQASTLWLLGQATDGDITKEQVTQYVAAQTLPSTEINQDENRNLMDDPMVFLPAMVAVGLLMMAVIMGMTTTSTGIVEEKQSRVIEILLSSVKPGQLLIGKILGIGSAVLLQFLLVVAAAVLALKIAGLATALNLGSIVGWTLVWTIVGFFQYTTLTGALASRVSRQEEVGSVTGPLTFVVVIAFYIAIYLVPLQPDAMVTKVLSWVPFLAPFMMPVRETLGVVPTWEQLGALGVSVVATFLVALLAGRIYKNSVLRTGQKVKLKEALGLAS